MAHRMGQTEAQVPRLRTGVLTMINLIPTRENTEHEVVCKSYKCNWYGFVDELEVVQDMVHSANAFRCPMCRGEVLLSEFKGEEDE